MRISALLDRAAFAVSKTVHSRAMAPTPAATGQALFPAVVTNVTAPSAQVRRISLSAPEFSELTIAGPDEYFGLLLPGKRGRVILPDASRINIRAAIEDMAEADRPHLRWYTIRSIDQESNSVEVDVVTHGDAGPGSAWALRAKPGDRVGFRQGGALFKLPPAARRVCFVIDETSAPGVAAILDANPGLAATVLVEVAAIDRLTPLPEHPGTRVIERNGHAPGDKALEVLQTLDCNTFDYFYLCGESNLATQCRRFLVNERGIDKKQIVFSGYWKQGQARG